MQLTINVPDGSDMASQIASWQDGSSYQFTATQTAPNTFDATEVAPAETESEQSPEDAGQEAESEPASKIPMHKNPAIAIVIGSGKGMKK